MPFKPYQRTASRAVALALTALALAAPAVAADPVENSTLDAPLFYQLLIGELELNKGDAGTAYQVMLDAARRTKDESLYRRAVEIALQARSGDRALQAARAWREDAPRSVDALRYIVQLLIVLNRAPEAAEPLRALVAAPPDADRVERIGSLIGLLGRDTDRKVVLSLVEQAVGRWLDAPAERVAAHVVLGRAALGAGDAPRAIDLARRAQDYDAASEGPALLGLEMMPARADAEPIVQRYLATPKARPAVRLVYARVLSGAQRYGDAQVQFEQVTQADDKLAAAWLSLGALYLEMRDTPRAETSLKRYLELADASPHAADDDDEDALGPSAAGVTQAQLMLAQVSEMKQDYPGAEAWLQKIDNPQRALEVQSRRASLMARQGRLKEARELIRATPERGTVDARAKLYAEVQLLRDQKDWPEASKLLADANRRFADDSELIYEQAMIAEKLNQLDDMERMLRRVIELKPDHQHAYNALGYSLADRNLRLPEARQLIAKALELAPGDPFITDSLGWVEYRLGNRDEALRLLREAYRSRPDVEIAAHLGEVLWAAGQLDEARQVWRDARGRDAGNEVLRETLARLRVDL